MRNSIYAEIRDQFRDRWREYYAAQQDGADTELLKGMKADLVAEQKQLLGERRDAASQELLSSRADLYRELLDGQQDIRHAFRARQEAGLDNSALLGLIEARAAESEMGSAFREAATELGARPEAVAGAEVNTSEGHVIERRPVAAISVRMSRSASAPLCCPSWPAP